MSVIAFAVNAHAKKRVRLIALAILSALVCLPQIGGASEYGLFSVRVDRWLPWARSGPVYGTDYTAAGARLGPPPTSALPMTPNGGCPPVSADTPCTGSWGTGPPGDGTSGSGGLIAYFSSDSPNAVSVPAYAVVHRQSSFVLPSTAHLPGYPVATRYYSYWNVTGFFYPANPNAATTTTTIQPASVTSLSSGYYDSPLRGGYIRITPGMNRFGGTMRFFNGPGYFFQGKAERPSSGAYADYRWNAIRTQSNHGNAPMRNAMTGPQKLGQSATYGSSRMTHSTLQTSWGSNLEYQFWAFSTNVPWTTGMVTVHQSLGPFSSPTHLVATGYDTRNVTTSGGVTGKLSLVQPFLYHNYPAVAAGTTGPVTHFAFMRRITLSFNPEPGGSALLVAGILGLVALFRVRNS